MKLRTGNCSNSSPASARCLRASVIGIASYVPHVAVLDFAGSMREAVQIDSSFAVFFPRPFDLIRRSSRTQKKFFGEWSSEEAPNCVRRGLESGAEFEVCAAFDETLHAEKIPAGSAAAAAAVEPSAPNSRRCLAQGRKQASSRNARLWPIIMLISYPNRRPDRTAGSTGCKHCRHFSRPSSVLCPKSDPGQ